MALNKVILSGRLTATPELKTTTSGSAVTTFRIAVQRNYKSTNGDYEADFITCQAWRSTAEFICRNFQKGTAISVVGGIQTRNYEDKDGNKRTAVEVIVNEAYFVESKNNNGSQQNTPTISVVGGNDVEFEEVTDDELPF